VLGPTVGQEFFAGYLVEQSLSVDNLFVFLLLFDYFRVPLLLQDRVLNWGIFGAMVMRAIMIGIGAAAIHNFHAILLAFAAILIYGSAKFFFASDDDGEDEDPSQNVIVKFSRSLFPSTDDFHGDKFFIVEKGVRMATPLFICLVAVEISDIVFAVDSIPAVFGVTEVRHHFRRFLLHLDCAISHSCQLHRAEPADCVFFQHVCYHGSEKSLHDFVEGGDRLEVLGAGGSRGTWLHRREDGVGVLQLFNTDARCTWRGGGISQYWYRGFRA
jgi:Integral membrane protein TerC family